MYIQFVCQEKSIEIPKVITEYMFNSLKNERLWQIVTFDISGFFITVHLKKLNARKNPGPLTFTCDSKAHKRTDRPCTVGLIVRIWDVGERLRFFKKEKNAILKRYPGI
jgi:hypothetical protein